MNNHQQSPVAETPHWFKSFRLKSSMERRSLTGNLYSEPPNRSHCTRNVRRGRRRFRNITQLPVALPLLEANRKKSATTGNDMHKKRERNDRINRIHYTLKIIIFKH